MMRKLLVLLLLLWVSPTVVAQDVRSDSGAGLAPADVPFGVGERLGYRVKFGPLRVGKAHMIVQGVERVDGHPTYHLNTVIEGSTPFYKLVDKQESWLDVVQLASRRYLQDSKQGNYERYRVIDFDLENLVYSEHNGGTGSIPAHALDDCSFVYFVRSLPLEVGETYEWNRYFRLDRNPVILQVLRRERVEVPAGEFSTIVVRPIIKSGGIFSEGGEAEIYITDDENRVPIKLVTKLKVGSIILELTDYTPGDPLTEAMLETM